MPSWPAPPPLLAGASYGVTRNQLDNTQARIQNLNQSIKSEEARIATLEKDIWSLDRQILETRKIVREERLAGRKQVFDARRELKCRKSRSSAFRRISPWWTSMSTSSTAISPGTSSALPS
ncbi:MAG: hypothetical protein R3F38_15365 [Gammaproteobacteria bacterium]